MPVSISRRAARLAAPVAFVAVLVLAGFGAYLRFVDSSGLAIDRWWQGLTRLTPGSAPFAVAVFLAEAGTAVGVAALAAIACALLFVVRLRRQAGVVATALLIGIGASELTKSLVLRPRPGGQLVGTHGSSFPSGHSMGAAALAVSLALAVTVWHWGSAALRRRMHRIAWLLAAVWAAAMMWSRAALQVHWLSDTLAGALLGVAAALVAHRLWLGPGRGASRVRRAA